MAHICFTPGGAGLLRQALRKIGVRQHVELFPDDLSVGPIDTNDPDERRVWEEANIRPPDDRLSAIVRVPPLPPLWDSWRSVADETRAFWDSALAAKTCTVWFTRRVPSEYCGFLAWVQRAGAKRYYVVDVSEAITIVDPRPVFSIAHVNHSHLDYRGLLADAAPLRTEDRERYLQSWKKLRSENAALRVLVNGDLVSAPIDYFDKVILSCIPANWRMARWVAGDASVALWDEHARQGNDKIIMSRLFALFEAGYIECRGDPSEWWRACEIRRNQPVGG